MKRKSIILALSDMVLSISMTISCSSETPEHKAAVALDAAIDSAMQASDPQKALELIDTLNARYPKEIDLRKASNLKKAKALEAVAMTKIPELDAIIESAKATQDSLRVLFIEERPSSALAPYLLYKAVSGTKFAAAAGIQPRVNMGQDALDVPWTLAANAGRNIGLNQVTVQCSDSQQFVMNATSADGQIASIVPEVANPLGQHLAGKPAVTITNITFTGNKGKNTTRGTETLTAAIRASWQLATTRQQLRSALVNRERYERHLQLSRDAAANAATN